MEASSSWGGGRGRREGFRGGQLASFLIRAHVSACTRELERRDIFSYLIEILEGLCAALGYI